MQKPGISIFILAILMAISCQSDPAESNSDAELTELQNDSLARMEFNDDEIIKEAEEKNTDTHPGYEPPVYRPRKLMSEDKYKIRSGTFDGFLVGNWTFDIKIDVGMDGIDETDKGRVLQLHKDMTYDIWDESTKVETGTFAWDRSNALLQFNPTMGNPSEWTVQYVHSSAILIGTPTFGNNAIQMRLKEGLVNFHPDSN